MISTNPTRPAEAQDGSDDEVLAALNECYVLAARSTGANVRYPLRPIERGERLALIEECGRFRRVLLSRGRVLVFGSAGARFVE